jgi:3-oxoacyl-[acyl-carrier protein] reductase
MAAWPSRAISQFNRSSSRLEEIMGSLTGKTALVTGAARGIGQAIALAFAKEGAHVAVLDRRKEDAEQTAARIRDLGVRGVAISADVGEESQVNAAVDTAIAALGRIDILVNNAGIESASLVADMPTEMWDRMMLINLRSVFLCTRAVLPGMRAQARTNYQYQLSTRT